jgi:hypothetical protein
MIQFYFRANLRDIYEKLVSYLSDTAENDDFVSSVIRTRIFHFLNPRWLDTSLGRATVQKPEDMSGVSPLETNNFLLFSAV